MNDKPLSLDDQVLSGYPIYFENEYMDEMAKMHDDTLATPSISSSSSTCSPSEHMQSCHSAPSSSMQQQPVQKDFMPTFYNPFETKHRRRTSRAQFKILETSFHENAKPNATMRRWLAQKLGMSPRSVQVWFQNRRAKAKMQLKKSPSTTFRSSPSSNFSNSSSSSSSSSSQSSTILFYGRSPSPMPCDPFQSHVAPTDALQQPLLPTATPELTAVAAAVVATTANGDSHPSMGASSSPMHPPLSLATPPSFSDPWQMPLGACAVPCSCPNYALVPTNSLPGSPCSNMTSPTIDLLSPVSYPSPPWHCQQQQQQQQPQHQQQQIPMDTSSLWMPNSIDSTSSSPENTYWYSPMDVRRASTPLLEASITEKDAFRRLSEPVFDLHASMFIDSSLTPCFI